MPNTSGLRPWGKGQCGNPGGRPRVPGDVREAAQALTPLAIRTLEEICQNKKVSPSARLVAASIILDRAWGKAIARSESHNLNVDLAQLSDAQLLAMLQELQPGAVLPGLAAPTDGAHSSDGGAVLEASNS